MAALLPRIALGRPFSLFEHHQKADEGDHHTDDDSDTHPIVRGVFSSFLLSQPSLRHRALTSAPVDSRMELVAHSLAPELLELVAPLGFVFV
jgi:hypothetical protein